jgi:adenylate cyclase
MIMQKAKQLLDAERCTMFLIDKEKQQLWSTVADGTEQIRIPINMGIAGYVVSTGEVLNIPEAYEDDRFNRDIDLKTGYRTRSILCMPLQNKQGETMGSLYFP